MDKRQLRQSAMADFMQSLEHLDELMGETTDSGVLGEDNLQPPEAEQPQQAQTVNRSQQTGHHPKARQSQMPHPNS